MTYKRFGDPEVLQLTEVDKPKLQENQVLIKIEASAVNDWDWSMVRGKPIAYRFLFGWLRPKHQIPGMEVAGIVQDVGSKVSDFKIGDAVYGDTSDFGFGGYAEFLACDQRAFVKKPENISFIEAASISHAIMLAHQSFEMGKIQEGQDILINGAGGGVGAFGLQLAKLKNCRVTGVDSADKASSMLDLGFDEVIDYRQNDFTKMGIKYDLILDAKSNHSPSAYKRVLKENGKYVSVGGTVFRIIQLALSSALGNKSVHVLALKPNKGLREINELVKANKIQFQIDGPYPLKDASKALRRFGEGKHNGKVVLVMEEEVIE